MREHRHIQKHCFGHAQALLSVVENFDNRILGITESQFCSCQLIRFLVSNSFAHRKILFIFLKMKMRLRIWERGIVVAVARAICRPRGIPDFLKGHFNDPEVETIVGSKIRGS